MAILCGVDIIEIDRLERSFQTGGNSFRDKVFTARESEYCDSKKATRIKSYAARFAAKEAVSKALGTGISKGIKWTEIEVENDIDGKPSVILSGKAKERFEKLKGKNISISLSHSNNYAVAYAVIEADES